MSKGHAAHARFFSHASSSTGTTGLGGSYSSSGMVGPTGLCLRFLLLFFLPPFFRLRPPDEAESDEEEPSDDDPPDEEELRSGRVSSTEPCVSVRQWRVAQRQTPLRSPLFLLRISAARPPFM